jgi:16S rRNA processing protein RimM
VSAENLTSGADRFHAGQQVRLFGLPRAGDGLEFEVEAVWEQKGRLIFKFRGIDSIDDAETLRGAEVRLPFSERLPLQEGEYYQSDLIGCELLDRGTGERLGVVTGLQEYGGPLLLEVETKGEPLLVPFARAICVEIDVANRRIQADLPEGLLDLGKK